MKVKVLKNFTDKYDKNIKYKVNDEIEITKDRFKEILTKGKLVEEIKQDKKILEKGKKKNGE